MTPNHLGPGTTPVVGFQQSNRWVAGLKGVSVRRSKSASSFLSLFIRVRFCRFLCHRPSTRAIAPARARRLRGRLISSTASTGATPSTAWEGEMPEKETIARARRDRREGKSPSTQAGEFVREEMHHVREGKHGARSSKQAIAIGLSKARRAGVKVPRARRGSAAASKQQASSTGGTKRAGKRPSARRSAAIKRALRREGHSAASHRALSRHAHTAARARTAAQRSASAKKAVRTKGPRARKAAARKAARTRARRS